MNKERKVLSKPRRYLMSRNESIVFAIISAYMMIFGAYKCNEMLHSPVNQEPIEIFGYASSTIAGVIILTISTISFIRRMKEDD